MSIRKSKRRYRDWYEEKQCYEVEDFDIVRFKHILSSNGKKATRHNVYLATIRTDNRCHLLYSTRNEQKAIKYATWANNRTLEEFKKEDFIWRSYRRRTNILLKILRRP